MPSTPAAGVKRWLAPSHHNPLRGNPHAISRARVAVGAVRLRVIAPSKSVNPLKQPLSVVVCSLLLSSALGACATRPAPGISGHWTAVNRFASSPQAIPLHPAYVFYATPMDRTLKTMLARWALDSKMPLDYGHPSDFTLYQPVADIHTGDLHQAVAQLNALYAANGVVVSVRDNAIVVRPLSNAPAVVAPDAMTAAVSAPVEPTAQPAPTPSPASQP